MGIYGRKTWFVANNLGISRENKTIKNVFQKIYDFYDLSWIFEFNYC